MHYQQQQCCCLQSNYTHHIETKYPHCNIDLIALFNIMTTFTCCSAVHDYHFIPSTVSPQIHACGSAFTQSTVTSNHAALRHQ